MKCLYYISSTIDSTHEISDDMQAVGINHWFLHVISKDVAGVKKHHMHSGNFIEQFDVMRDAIIGAFIGLVLAFIIVSVIIYNQYFPPEVPNVAYYFIIGILVLFCSWEGGLIGIGNESKKLAEFHDDLEAGKYLTLVYVPRNQEQLITDMMTEKHPDIRLEGIDSRFYNPLSKVQRI